MTAVETTFPSAPTDARTELRAKVRELEVARYAHEQLVRQVDAVNAAHAAKHEALFVEELGWRRSVAQLEGEVRQLGRQVYDAQGQKALVPGVNVREVKRVVYTEAAALEWARGRGMALALDRKAFEKIAIADPSAVPCADVRTEPQVTISSDLLIARQVAEATQGQPAGAP